MLEWGGEYEDSGDAQAALFGRIPMFVALMILITIALFNSLRQPLVIWLCVPLALIGVTIGLLATGQPFGFMALLGFLSLMGMLIKNAIVLVDQINVELAEGKGTYDAIVSSGVSRLRPVAMAACDQRCWACCRSWSTPSSCRWRSRSSSASCSRRS